MNDEKTMDYNIGINELQPKCVWTDVNECFPSLENDIPDLNLVFETEMIINDKTKTREEKQLLAKSALRVKLNEIYPTEKTDEILNNIMRNNQYLFTLALLEVLIYSDKLTRMIILEAIMNAGKSFIITNLFPIIFDYARYYGKLNNLVMIDSIFVTSYIKEVVDQFRKDVINLEHLKYIERFFYETSGKMLLIVNDEIDDEFSDLVQDELNYIHVCSPNSVKQFKKMFKMNNIEYDLLMFNNLHATSEELSPVKNKDMHVFKDRQVLAISDEFQSGTGLDIDGIFTYGEVTGFENKDYKGTILNSLKKEEYIKQVIGITGTATIAHKQDIKNFKTIEKLVVKEEVLDFTKNAKAYYIANDEERVEAGFAELRRKDDLYPDRKSSMVIQIPPDLKSGSKDDYMNGKITTDSWEFIIMKLAEKYGYTEDNIIKNYSKGTKKQSDLSLEELVSTIEDYDSDKKILIVKKSFSAGINVKNIQNFCVIPKRKDLTQDQIYNILQRIMRAPRFYKCVENNAQCHSDLKTKQGRELNTVSLFLPPDFDVVVSVLSKKFLNIEVM